MTTVAKRAGAAVDWLGELEHTPLAEVIRRLVIEERSGDLRITSPTAVKTIHFDRGFIVFASSNLRGDSLGERLISSGRISPHEFALVNMLTKGSKRSFRQTLSHAGIVPEEELGRHVAAQVNQIALSLFSWKEGTYAFEEGPCSIPLELMVSLSAHRILLEGIRRMSSGKLILAGLPPLDTMIRVVQAPPFSLDFQKLRPAEKAVLRIADTRIAIRQILARSGEDKGKVLRACYALYASGVVESVSEDVRKMPRRVQEETGTFVVSEILRKIAPKEDARAVDEASKPLEKVRPVEQADKVREMEAERAPVSLESRFPPRTEEEAATPALKSFEEFEAEQAGTTGDALPSAGDGRESLWARGCSSVVATAKALWVAVSTAFRGARLLWDELRVSAGRGSTAAGESEPGSSFESSATATETFDPEAAPLSRPRSLVPPVDRVGQEDASERPSVPSWSVVDDPQDAPLPTTDPADFIKPTEDGPEITSLGVPKWSMRDDPHEAPAPPKDAYQEKRPRYPTADERLGSPSWSLEDHSRGVGKDRLSATSRSQTYEAPPEEPADIVLGSEDLEPAEKEREQDAEPEILLRAEEEDSRSTLEPASPSVDVQDPFADFDGQPPSTQELLIELEPEDGSESSMLNAIPVETPHVDDELDLVIVVEEDAFEDLPDVPDELPPPARRPETVQPELEATAKKPPDKVQKRQQPKRPAPVEAAKPAPPPKKKRSGPPPITPNVELPKQSPRVPPPAKPSFDVSPTPQFDVAPAPSFNETPLAEAPRAAAPPADPGRGVTHAPPSPQARPASSVREAPPSPPAGPPSPVRQAPPPPRPVARPSVRGTSDPGRAQQDTPSRQPAIGAATEQSATPDVQADIASEGMMRARRMQQGGGEERILRDVKLHFKVRDWAGAVRLLEELVAIAPGSALYRGMLARAMSRHPTLRHDAEEQFLEALRLAPQDPEIHYWLGVYYLSFGLKARAINEFKTTLRIDPRHDRARQQMSGGRSAGGGVFKKLFG